MAIAALAVVAVAVDAKGLAVVANGAGLAVELAVEPTLALRARSLFFRGGHKTAGDGEEEASPLFCQGLDYVHAVAKFSEIHFHSLTLCHRLESTPMVLQLCQRLGARLLNT